MDAGTRGGIISTLFTRDAPIDQWLREVRMIAPGKPWSTVAELVRRARHSQAVIIDGSSHYEQVAAALISIARRPPKIVISDATWTLSANPLDRKLNRLGVRLIDGPYVTFCVLSHYEEESFRSSWGPLAAQVRFTPWKHNLSPAQLEAEPGDDGSVFAGGNSLRDYGPLLEAARSLSARVEIATNVLSDDEISRAPANVNARPVPQAEFDRLMGNASVVVVPMEPRTDRSCGQSTYVSAMALGKAVIVTEVPGIRDYIDDGRTGVIVPYGDAGALRSAISRLLDDPQERAELGARAREYALEHNSLERYAQNLLEITHQALEG